MNFSEHILELRVKRGILQKDIAKEVGISLQTYQRYEYGTREPKLSALIALADYYGMTLDELVCREFPQQEL